MPRIPSLASSWLFSSLLALTAACAPAKPAATRAPEAPPVTEVVAPEPLAYALSPEFDQGALVALRVELRLRGDRSGITRLELPQQWGTAEELWNYIRDLEIDGATSVVEEGPAVRVVHAGPDAPLTIRYRVVSGFDHDPTTADGQPFKPIIRPDWFDLYGETLFVIPADREDHPATFTWRGAPDGFHFASDLEHLAGARPGTVSDVRESVVIGGTGLQTRADPSGQIRVAILGAYDFTHEAFFELALAVIAAQRAFWGDTGAPFLVTLAPQTKTPNRTTASGTGRSDAFTLSVSENLPFEMLRHLLAHEYFHTWNARELGGQMDGPEEGLGKWFSEGFTEFYTWRLLLRAGLYSLEDFVAAWNEALIEYWTSPAREEPNTRVAADYWKNYDVGRLPYRRGPLLAALWEQQLRRATNGARDLDDVVHAMRAKVRDAGERKLARDAASLFAPTYREVGGPDLSADLERFVDKGATISLPADVFGDCVHVESKVRRKFERGWDADATTAADGVITGLRKDSPAYRAGLRDGMKIVRREAGEPGDSTIPYVLRVLSGKRERLITFKPEGAESETLEQLVLDKALDPERRAACVRTLAGL